MIVLYSPSRGYFAGCESGGFGGIEGDPTFDHDFSKALDLDEGRVAGGRFTFEEIARQHLGYVRDVPNGTKDTIALEGRSRKDLERQAAVHSVHSL